VFTEKENTVKYTQFLARDVIYTSRAYTTMPVSVCRFVCVVCALWSQGAMDPGYLSMLGLIDVCATY